MRTLIFIFVLLMVLEPAQARRRKKKYKKIKNAIARVAQVKGAVTMLLPGSKKAKIVKKGQRLPPDTSIVTKDKAFVRIIYKDKTQVNLRPNSKIIIVSKKPRKPGVLNLLKGHLRAKVVKRGSSRKNKFYIKTQTAAMGIRGTEFETVYNTDNRITTVVTLKGDVRMAKIDPNVVGQVKRRRKKLKKKVNNKGVDKVSKVNPLDLEELDKVLESHVAVSVKDGRFAGVMPKQKRASKPQRVNPEQLVAMINEDKKEKDKIKDIVVKDFKDDVPPEGIVNEKTGDYAPRAGGFVDLKTGIYLPPPKEAKFDKEHKVFVPPKEYGKVNEKTGDYVPPKGLELDAVSGFVLAEEKKDTEDKVLFAQLNIINQDIKSDILAPSMTISTDVIFPDHILNQADPWHFHSLIGYGTTSNVLETYYTENVATSDHANYAEADFNFAYIKSPKARWQVNPKADFHGLYYFRRNNQIVFRNNQVNITGGSDFSNLHSWNGHPAVANISATVHTSERVIDQDKKLSTFTKHAELDFSESLQVGKLRMKFAFALASYEGYKVGDRGSLLRPYFSFSRSVSASEKVELRGMMQRKATSQKIQEFDRDILGLGASYHSKELLPKWNFHLASDYYLIDRKEDSKNYAEKNWVTTAAIERNIAKRLSGVLQYTLLSQDAQNEDSQLRDYTSSSIGAYLRYNLQEL